MSNIKDMDFLDAFPPALKKDPAMTALGRLIADELHITADETERNIIYTNIDNLSETWLDRLAYDLHVDWYDYDYPEATKKAVIKNSIKVHQKLGTKYAVETALKDIYKTAKATEWFEYGGEAYHFKILVDIGNTGLSESICRRLETEIAHYKSLRSHCDGIYYRLGAYEADIKIKSYADLGSVLKVKAALPKEIGVSASVFTSASLSEGGKIKVKAKLAESLAGKKQGYYFGSQSAKNTIKVKAKLAESLAGKNKNTMFGSQSAKNIMLIRRENAK